MEDHSRQAGMRESPQEQFATGPEQRENYSRFPLDQATRKYIAHHRGTTRSFPKLKKNHLPQEDHWHGRWETCERSQCSRGCWDLENGRASKTQSLSVQSVPVTCLDYRGTLCSGRAVWLNHEGYVTTLYYY